VREFITLKKIIQRGSGELVLCDMDPQIHEIFEITSLDKIFKIMNEEQQALQAF
jgi:anti-sigma B factor antagonist